ncbi:MAG TPA: GDP-fucose synthetase [Lentisphaeria bacterium]|nr:MAG: GDP-fucose synthetase [Lentisphaerae bacterium GWF2_38_69]HBM17540.1 GDP-fucose synthetase [Lentisphaeria bacterium]
MEQLNKRIYIAGHKGLAGSAIHRKLTSKGYSNLILRTGKELDLRDHNMTFEFFRKEKPEWVFLAAGRVGGIYANNTYPVNFLLDNLKIQNNIIEASYKFGVEKLLFLGSSCIYPKFAPQPLKEESLLTSSLEPTNEPYAIAKIAGIKLCSAMNRQYGTNFVSAMPTNLYGINDNYHKENAHMPAMLIRRFHEAKISGLYEVTVWGTGTPKREIMCSDDLADGLVFLMGNYDSSSVDEIINIGTGVEHTISEIAQIIKEVVGYKGEILYDTTKPDGTPRKLMDVSKIAKLGWSYKINLIDGLRRAYEDFLVNHSTR